MHSTPRLASVYATATTLLSGKKNGDSADAMGVPGAAARAGAHSVLLRAVGCERTPSGGWVRARQQGRRRRARNGREPDGAARVLLLGAGGEAVGVLGPCGVGAAARADHAHAGCLHVRVHVDGVDYCVAEQSERHGFPVIFLPGCRSSSQIWCARTSPPTSRPRSF